MPLLTIRVEVSGEINHRFHRPPGESPAAILAAITELKGIIMAAIDNLEAEVNENTDATQSAVILLGNLKTALDEAIASGSMAKVQELADKLDANSNALAASVAANTPADPNA